MFGIKEKEVSAHVPAPLQISVSLVSRPPITLERDLPMLLSADSIPLWLYIVAYAYLSVGFGTAGYIVIDILHNNHKNRMKVMNAVWPVSGFYLGPLALWEYWHIGHMNVKKDGPHDVEDRGKKMSSESKERHPGKFQHPIPTHSQETGRQKPMRERVFVSATHCGAGCMLGDVIGEWVVFLANLAIGGILLWSYYIVDYMLAWGLGILFQNASIMQMKKKSFRMGLPEAVKAETLSLTLFEVGLFGWMAFSYFVIFGGTLHPENPVYRFGMQFGMVLGFFTSYPANWWLVKKSIKEIM